MSGPRFRMTVHEPCDAPLRSLWLSLPTPGISLSMTNCGMARLPTTFRFQANGSVADFAGLESRTTPKNPPRPPPGKLTEAALNIASRLGRRREPAHHLTS